MNIKEAKQEIKNAMTAYFTKNDYGEYVIPIEKQRPIFLMGAPGIGKTAIMEQIAEELNVELVSYSMTHHTRQSALGLPFIEKKRYGDKEYSISEYTMSEIIASVYDKMEETGKKEGILFLDEINCVSETLAPSMLQFLQFKIFGRHRVPDGWIVVTAGNPPEYNNSVREFDIVTWDRLKRVDVEPDYDAWKEYAINSGVHPAIISYLDTKRGDFYKIETTVDGKRFVTARGWSDLSAMIALYEKNDIPVTRKLVGQYLQNEKVAKEFSIYYDLFVKYRSDYRIEGILQGEKADEIVKRAARAKFDERLALLSLLIDAVYERMEKAMEGEQVLGRVLEIIKTARVSFAIKKNMDVVLKEQSELLEKEIALASKSASVSVGGKHVAMRALSILEEMRLALHSDGSAGGAAVMLLIKKEYDARVKAHKDAVAAIGSQLTNVFTFLEKAFGEGQEMLIFVTELTINLACTWYISHYGCDKYFDHNKELLFYERQKSLIEKIARISDLKIDDDPKD